MSHKIPQMPAHQISQNFLKFRNIDELQKAVSNDDKLSDSVLEYKRVLKSGDMNFDNAVLQYKNGDEESAYILYMRAIDFYRKAKQCRDYDDKTWASMCVNNLNEATIKCEELTNSLTRRYSNLTDPNEAYFKELQQKPKIRDNLDRENFSNFKNHELCNMIIDNSDDTAVNNHCAPRTPSSTTTPKLIAGDKKRTVRSSFIVQDSSNPILRALPQYDKQGSEYFTNSRQGSEYFTNPVGNSNRESDGTVQFGLTGLQNLGFTCYMNSTIQCLSHTKVLRDYFMSYDYIRDINFTNNLGSKGKVAKNFAILVESLWSGKYRYVVPKEFKEIIGNVAEQFRGYEQQDAQEFAIFLLDGLHEDLNRVKIREKLGDQINTNVHLDVAAQRAWQNYLKVNNSIIVDHFQGQFLSVITCTVCKAESKVFDGLMYLSVPLPSEKCSLDDCLKMFLESERMCDDAKWFCPRCTCKRDAYKKFVIWKLAKILVIHLKRFTKRDTENHQKLETFVDFPVSTNLNMNPYVIGESPPGPYKLYAVVNHFGTMDSGHYTAHCKMNNNWYRFDDCNVEECFHRTVKSDAAYILFFTL